MSITLLTEHFLEFLSLKGGSTCSSMSTLVKMPHCWKSRGCSFLVLLKLCVGFRVICRVVFLTSVDSDESVQPPFKPRNFKFCSVSSLTLIEYSSE